MPKINQIQARIRELNPATFQSLCDSYIYRKYEYADIKSIGTVVGKDKTKSGTPDALFRTKDGKPVFAEYTTEEHGVVAKFLDDLAKCSDEEKTQIRVAEIAKIFLCHNGRLSTKQEAVLTEAGKEKRLPVELIGIDRLAQDIFFYFPKLASDYLNIDVDSGQILHPVDFLREYHKNPFSTRLDTHFYFRDEELHEILKHIESQDIVVVSGRAGVGKSRLALEAFAQFLETHSDYKAYCLFNKQGLSLYRDLRDYFATEGNYLVFVDDANRVSELQHLLAFINENSETRNLRIILTVRDYALDSILNKTQSYKTAAIELQPFESDKLREFISKEFDITTAIFLERIDSIAKGNARIAVMAATIAKKADRFDSILNVEGIYDEYFASILQDLDILNNSSIVRVAGIVSLFRVVNFGDAELRARISSTFGIEETDFVECAVQLHGMEIVELYENQIVKISDQVLATYLFYKTFFKDTLLSFDGLLKDFFDTHKNAIIDAVYPTFDAFDTDFLREKIKPSLEKKWAAAKTDELAALSFIEVFFPLKETESLLYLRNLILGSKQWTYTGEHNTPSKHVQITDRYLSILSLFRQASPNAFQTAVDLVFVYLDKRPNLLPEVLRLVTENWSFRRHSNWEQYVYETSLVNKLIARQNTQDSDPRFTRFLMEVADNFLGMVFRSNESRGMSAVTIHTFGLAACDEIYSLRESLWGSLFLLFDDDSYKPDVLKIIGNYLRKSRADECNRLIAEKDAMHLLPFLNAKLDSTDYQHCHIVQDYLSFLEKLGIPFDERARNEFRSEVYEIGEIILDPMFRLLREVEFNDLDSKKLELITPHLGKGHFSDYKHFLTVCGEIQASVGKQKDYQIEGMAGLVLHNLSEVNPTLFIEVLKEVLQSGNPLSLDGYVVFPIVRRLLDIIGRNDTYHLLEAYEYSRKMTWLSIFYAALKPNEIDTSITADLKRFYQESPSMIGDLAFTRNYVEVSPRITIEIVRIIWRRIKNGDFQFNFFTFFHRDFKHQIADIFTDDTELLKNIYFYQMKNSNIDDYDRSVFKEIYRMDSKFPLQYVQWLYSEADYLSDRDRSVNYDFIWQAENAERELKEILEFGYHESANPLSHFHNYVQIYFGSYGEEVDLRMKEFLNKYIRENVKDLGRVTFIFHLIAEIPHLQVQIKDFLSVFLSENKNFSDFRRLQLEPMGGSWTGSAVPMYAKKIEFLETILPLFQEVDFLDHKNFIEKQIDSRREDIQAQLRREFVESAYL